jgi:glycosyltransferase involved in cell wall biosynthesis
MISIITPLFNSASTLRDCLSSVELQTAESEHIVIEGKSTDDSLDIVKSYPHVCEIVSEIDEGVYDAMNKGVRLAKGDIIGILNADDFYANVNVLEQVARVFENPTIDSCYGDLVYVDRNNISRTVRYWKAGPFSYRKFYWGWMLPHPTFFVRRKVYEKYGIFNLNLGSAADYELMLRFLVKHRITAAYIPEVLVKMRTGGISNLSTRNRIRANRMDHVAWKVNGLKPYPWTTYLKPLRKIGQFLTRDH